ncbi:MAG TPA: hypothetical protein VGN63_01835 [Flavisolibacter sp.]|jgi:hypothetical protein|nr:hypothetical protein [Flavisolibacter sp.]
MRYSISFTSVKAFLTVITIILFLVCAGIFASYLLWVKKYEVAFGFIPMFNLDGEFNVPTMFSVLLIGLNSLLLFLVGKHSNTADHLKKYWSILGSIFLYLAFDEMTSTHERIGGIVYRLAPGVIHTSESRYWMLPFGILLAVFALSFFRFYLHLPQRTRISFTLAGLVYITGVMGIEYLGDLYVASQIAGSSKIFAGDLTYSLIACVEEVFELIGMALFFRALLVHLQSLSNSRYFHLSFLIGNPDKSSLFVPDSKREESIQQ